MKRTLTTSDFGYNFINGNYIPPSKDEYFLRNQQQAEKKYRLLTEAEIIFLKNANNTANNWGDIWVTAIFDVNLIKNCNFYGRIRIGNLENGLLQFQDTKLPIGLYNSMIISCDIGDYNVINHVHLMSHYITGNETILFNINELQTSNYAKFGNGIKKEDETEATRIWLEICNENAGRKVLPFNGMLTSDAWLWSKFRDDKLLMSRFQEITESEFSSERGFYGTIGDGCVIKNCQIIKDVKIGDAAYIKGGNKLKNLTINSSFETPTQLGEGCELVNGIVGYGCKIFYGVKAVRFIACDHSSLKYGARLINSVLGENSTISCCEVLNSLIFPGHEQHHNNSFLIASTILGQSNIAAGATIGSNHNSRANDGEIIAGRGFWPGLSVSLKHNSVFASYVLLSKGNYPAELNISLPFTLLGNSETENSLIICPAYWWRYNMYALARNSWKYKSRDNRKVKHQKYEFDYLAPDTVQEIFTALHKIENWTAQFLKITIEESKTKLLTNDVPKRIYFPDVELDASGRNIIILKPDVAYNAYREMVHYFCIKTILEYSLQNGLDLIKIIANYKASPRADWYNLGGQLMKVTEINELINDVKTSKLNSWNEIHFRYQEINTSYEIDKLNFALTCLTDLYSTPIIEISEKEWISHFSKTQIIAKELAQKTFESRKKDYSHPSRKMVYKSDDEMNEVIGKLENNSFINTVFQEMNQLVSSLENSKNQFNLTEVINK